MTEQKKVETKMTQKTIDDLDFIRLTMDLNGNNTSIAVASDVARNVVNHILNIKGSVIFKYPDGKTTEFIVEKK